MLSLLSCASRQAFIFTPFDDEEQDEPFGLLQDDYSKIIDLPELALRATFSQGE